MGECLECRPPPQPDLQRLPGEGRAGGEDPAGPAPRLAQRRDRRAALKAEMFAAYGGRCACCGEAVALFLRVERVRPDEKAPNEYVGHVYWRRLQAAGWPDTHGLFCANCSLGRAVHGVCPHRGGGNAGSGGEQAPHVSER